MATRKLLKHASDSIAANKLITFNIPAFHTIHQMGLTFTNSGAAATLANIVAGIGKITVLINGEQIVNASADHIAKFWQSLGTQVGASTLVNAFPLMLPNLLFKNTAVKDVLGIGCDRFTNGVDVTNIQIQIQCNGTVTGLTDVQAYTERVDKGKGKNITSVISKILSYFQGFTTTGTSEVDTLPRDSNMVRLSTLAIPDSTGVISSGESLVNNDPVIQDCDIATDDLLVAQRGFAKVSGVFNYLYANGGTTDWLSMDGVTDMRCKTTFTTACTTGYTLLDVTARKVS